MFSIKVAADTEGLDLSSRRSQDGSEASDTVASFALVMTKVYMHRDFDQQIFRRFSQMELHSLYHYDRCCPFGSDESDGCSFH